MNVTKNSKVRSKVRSTDTTIQQPAHMPSGNTTALRKYRRAFWVSQYFQKSCFPTMAYCIFCDMSQFTTPPPPHPHPLSGAQIRSITGTRFPSALCAICGERGRSALPCLHHPYSAARGPHARSHSGPIPFRRVHLQRVGEDVQGSPMPGHTRAQCMEGGGGGAKVCVLKMAQINISFL